MAPAKSQQGTRKHVTAAFPAERFVPPKEELHDGFYIEFAEYIEGRKHIKYRRYFNIYTGGGGYR